MDASRGAAVDAATRAHFTDRAAQYSGSGEASLEALLALVDARPGERVLDVATGTGMVLFPLAERVGPSGVAAGVDFTPAMLGAAGGRRQDLPPDARPALVAAHAARLPFRPGTFDAVTCRYAVHHFSDAAAGLAAMAAALRPGGRLVIADFVRPESEAAGAVHDRLEALRGHVFVRIYPRSGLEAMLAAAGCPVVERREAERAFRPADLLDGPNVDPANRPALAAAVAALTGAGGGGFRLRRDGAGDESVRLVRSDAVLLAVRR
jgi:SAM-dependent methyltransferase